MSEAAGMSSGEPRPRRIANTPYLVAFPIPPAATERRRERLASFEDAPDLQAYAPCPVAAFLSHSAAYGRRPLLRSRRRCLGAACGSRAATAAAPLRLSCPG
eukprot:scaffold71_cov247-Pinguiococcus_pyrenoidosus.AAC.6